MSFGALKTRLKALINRKDLTADDALAGTFITDAIVDMERVLRIGPMESLLTQDEWVGNVMLIPATYLETINLFTDDGELTQVDMATFLARPDCGGAPTHYVKVADRWLLKPTPAPGTKVYLHYYSQSTKLKTDEDTNVWTESCGSATLYQAASLAADFYQMEDVHAQRFAGRASDFVAAITDQDIGEKWSGRVSIPYPSDIGPY